MKTRARLGTWIVVAAVMAWFQVGSAQSSQESGQSAPIVAGGERTNAELMAEAAVNRDASADAFVASDLVTGSTFSAISLTETSVVPPDPSLAAGPTQVVVIANGRMRSFNKTTGLADGVLNLNPNTFFSSVRSAGSVFGGRVRFDRWTGRWFVTMATDGIPGRVVIASSNTATITSTTVWRFSGFDNTFTNSTCGIDMPTLAIDSLALYVGVNQFCGGTYAGTSAFVVRKSSALDTATLVVTAFHNLTDTPGGTGPFAPQGADNAEAAATSGYFLGVDNATFGTLVLRRVTNPGGVPTLSANIPFAVPMTGGTVPVPHQGNTGGANGRLDAGDDRLGAVQWRGGRLWAVHALGVTESGVAGTNRNGIRWYEVGSIDSTPVIVQSGALHSTTGPGSTDERHYWSPSLTVTTLGRTVVGFNTAGTSEFINGGTATRMSSDPAGALTAPVLFTNAAAAYNPALDAGSSRGRRWGRYSDTVTDGCDGTTAWTVQAHTDTTNTWLLQVARLRAGRPPALISVTPATVYSGVASINLTLTADDSASFLDAPAGYACRLAASIPGVTVNSVVISSPTTLTVNVSTLATSPGSKAITVTHPDGQTAPGTIAVTVSQGADVVVDTPLFRGQPLIVTGWAVDGRAAAGIGVDAVEIYAYPASGNPVFLGSAVLGIQRNDVASVLGARYARAGFTLRAGTLLTPGVYNVVTYAHSSATGAYTSRVDTVTLPAVTPPFGHVDTPTEGTTVSGEIGFTGWALDAGGVREVRVFRNSVAGEPAGEVFVGNADFVRGARPDVQAAFPGLPDNDAAGWGFSVLTNMLPNSGNGVFTFSLYATNYAGVSTRIGTRQLTAANAGAVRPFGTIDTPGQGAEVSGVIVNFGWVLTNSPLGIPVDGSTIDVYVDGVFQGHPVYNQYRSDIATLFPGLVNSNGAVGYFMIDTRLLADGLHSVVWGVRDSAGNVNGIGSRNFRVKNGS
jgi:hypothetical protein